MKNYPKKKTRPTILDPHKEYIQIEVNKDIQAKRIFEDLVRDYDYQGSYDTVKKYIHSIREKKSKVYMVLNTQPGEEAQVDFGYIGLLNINGKKEESLDFCNDIELFKIYVCADSFRPKSTNIY